MTEAIILFQPEGIRTHAILGESILEAARRAKVDIPSICDGKARCGKCRIILKQGGDLLSPITESELKYLPKAELTRGYRLSCCAFIARGGTIVVEVPLETRLGRNRFLVEGIEAHVELLPIIKKLTLKIPKPTLNDITPDMERLTNAIKKYGKIEELYLDYEVLKTLPDVIRKGRWIVTVVLWDGKEVICVEPRSTCHKLYGVAIDIGTTKLACYLVDLNTGEILTTTSALNPQIPYGEDVISRIAFSLWDQRNLSKLQEVIIDKINMMIKTACAEVGIKPEEVYDMTVVGNTCMHHIFLKLNPKYLSLSPFTPVVGGSLNVKARDLVVLINKGAYVYIGPCVAGFIGADVVADMLATEIYRLKELSICIDIGTNTEIMIGNERKLMACSCASGPAFEGGHIEHGMRAVAGAIERIFIDPESLEITYKTIDGARPRGLCGSAMVDIVAEMLKARVIDSSGKFNKELKSPRLRLRGLVPELVIAWSNETDSGREIVITQRDVYEIQLAKAAIYTGISILMKKMGVTASDIKNVFLVGAFGTYLDPRSAKVIGMYPDVPLDRVKFLGNTAGSGARMMLKSTKARKIAEELRSKIEYLELGADPDFEKEFTKALFFPHLELERFPSVRGML